MDKVSPILIFGAGCIGRGLLGELAAKENRPLVFVEACALFASALQEVGEFAVRQVGRTESTTVVRDFRVLTLEDTADIEQALTDCAFVATAVGGMHLESVAQLMAPMLAARSTPLNILLCENWPKADQVLAEALVANGVASDRFSAVSSSVERMVQAVPDTLDLLAESDESAWVDRSKWLGDEKPLTGLNLCDNLEAYYARKLYTNNAGHALLAYEGFLAGHQTLVEAVQNPAIRTRLKEMLKFSAQMLELEYGLDRAELAEHLETLVQYRFANRELADRIERVARQPLRKLGPNDRLVGLLRKLERHRLPIRPICRTLAAGMRYRQADDDESQRLQSMIQSDGPARVLKEICQINAEESAFRVCLEEWDAMTYLCTTNQGEKHE
jgi:mannitol-1-phosphate 5-dehydrogenase